MLLNSAQVHKLKETRKSMYSRNMHWVTLVTEVYSLQEEVLRGGETRRRVIGRKKYYHPLPCPLIKRITSNMFLMMVKAGGN